MDEARRALVDLQSDPEAPNALLVVDEDGTYAGVLTRRLLLKHLLCEPLPERSPVNDEARWNRELLATARKCADRSVRNVLAPDLPVVARDDDLVMLIQFGCEHHCRTHRSCGLGAPPG